MRPELILLDAGGVFLLPETSRIMGAFERAECDVDPGVLTEAHYRAACEFHTGVDVEADWAGPWKTYLRSYVFACGVDDDHVDEAHLHVDSEFAEAALWVEPIPGAKEGLQALLDAGLRVGIVSNADGIMGQRLAQLEICQVGPGIGVPIECVIDSGNIGIMKPDPRIFAAALDVLSVDADRTWYVGDMPAIDVVGARRAGIHAVAMDPFDLHGDKDYDATPSLGALAERLAG